MKTIAFLFVLLIMLSCYSSKIIKPVRDHGDCNVAYLNIDNNKNDTSRVKFIKGVVFDTTATLIHGFIVDSAFHPILNADITLFNSDKRIKLLTNSVGEFEIFQRLEDGGWNLLIKHENYVCLYVVDVIQTGGQWFYIKLEHK
jgi:hypothetical protein